TLAVGLQELALHALDVPVHHQKVFILHALALGDALLAALIRNWTREDLISPSLRISDDLVGSGADIFGKRFVVGRHAQESLFETPPDVVRLPRAVEHRLGALD